MASFKRILFGVWAALSLLWLSFWGNVVGLRPDAIAILAQPRYYLQIVLPPLILGAAFGAVFLIVRAIDRHLRSRLPRRERH
jgi:hypothetical protein